MQKDKNFEENLLFIKIDIFKALVKSTLPKKKVRGIMNFLQHYVHFGNPENSAKFEEAIIAITGKSNVNMGTEEYLLQKAKKEGIQVGEEKSKIAFVKSLLSNTDFNNEKIASLADVTVAFVNEMKAQTLKQ